MADLGGALLASVCCIFFLEKYPPTLLFAFGYEMYDASEYIWRIVPLLLHSVSAYGCDTL